jgi:hypothetical protein
MKQTIKFGHLAIFIMLFCVKSVIGEALGSLINSSRSMRSLWWPEPGNSEYIVHLSVTRSETNAGKMALVVGHSTSWYRHWAGCDVVVASCFVVIVFAFWLLAIACVSWILSLRVSAGWWLHSICIQIPRVVYTRWDTKFPFSHGSSKLFSESSWVGVLQTAN